MKRVTDLKVGQKVWKVKINRPEISDKKYLLEKDKKGVQISELKIIGISDVKICLNDTWFSTFYIQEGRKTSHENYLDVEIVSIRTKESYFTNGVFVTLYSTKKPTNRTLQRMVGKANLMIDKEYGFLLNGAKNELHEIIESYTF